MRLPGLKLMGAHGDGFIDPLDPEYLCREISGGTNRILGTVRIPTGEHLQEMVHGNRILRNSISLLAARG